MQEPSETSPQPEGTSLPADNRFANVPVEISVLVGTARPIIRELLELEEDVILPLDRAIDDKVDLCIGDRPIARGILEEMGEEGSGQLCVRVTEILSRPSTPT